MQVLVGVALAQVIQHGLQQLLLPASRVIDESNSVRHRHRMMDFVLKMVGFVLTQGQSQASL